MELEELESFIAVARLGSFTKAAKERHLAQPGISRHIQRLEQELGVILLERRRGSSLTGPGYQLLAYAKDALERHRRFFKRINSAVPQVTGSLRIAASSTPGEFLLPDWLTTFSALNADVQPEVFIADPLEVVKEIQEQRSDIGFVGIPVSVRDLNCEEVAFDQVVLIAPAGHAFARRRNVDIEELQGQIFVEREGKPGTLTTFLNHITQFGIPMPEYRSVMTVSSTQALLSAVQQGHGIAFVSAMALDAQDFNGIVPITIAGLPLRRSLYMLMDRNRSLPAAPSAFAEWVREERSSTNHFLTSRTILGTATRPL